MIGAWLASLRWGAWWAVTLLGSSLIAVLVAENCRSILGRGEDCSGLGQWLYDNEGAPLALVVLAVVGAPLLNRAQEHFETRPCPRCGNRVAVGRMDCDHCNFDFRRIG